MKRVAPEPMETAAADDPNVRQLNKESKMSNNSQEDTGLTKTEKTLIRVFKRLGLPCDLTVGVVAIILQTDEQRAKMSVWMWDNKITDQKLIVKKALELAKQEAST